MTNICVSCGHDWEYHRQDGCWYAVKQARPGTNAACPCSASKSYDVHALARELLRASQDKFTRMVLDELDPSRVHNLSFVSTSNPPVRQTAPLRVRCTTCTRPCMMLKESGIDDTTYAGHPSRGACGVPARKWTGSMACDVSQSVVGV